MSDVYSRLSIKYKLFGTTIVSGLFSVVLALLILLTMSLANVKDKAKQELQTAANLIAGRSVAAFMFDDPPMVRENLSSLDNMPNVLLACVYTRSGHLYTSREINASDCPNEATGLYSHIDQLTVHTVQPMEVEGETIGSVYISADLAPAILSEMKLIGVVLAVLFISFGITLVLETPFLNRIAEPIAILAKTAKSIGDNEDYSLRAVKQSRDELGVLVDAFNGMLNTVEAKDKAVTIAKNNYQTLYDNNPTMVFNLDHRGVVVSVNQFGAQQLGTNADTLIGVSFFDFVHPDDADANQKFIRQCQQHPEKVHKLESRIICSDSTIIWVRITARQVNDTHSDHLLLVCEDITETRQLAEKIIYQATHDELTGLVNRHQFDMFLQNLVNQVQRDCSQNVLCYLDLDQFKVVNDTGGHMAGDELLRELSEILRSHVRKTDVLARLGGDEFGILMIHCTTDQAMVTCDRLRNAVRDFKFSWESHVFNVSVSIGVAPINCTTGNAADILKEADAACYAAKDKGRNRVHVFNPDNEELLMRHGEMQWIEKIKTGIELNQFLLYGQRIMPINDKNEGLHFETLIRYRDEQGRIVPPGAFLPAAERYDMAPALDRWVISRLFQFLHDTPRFLDRLAICSVNLSALSLTDENMLDFIDKQIDAWQIPTHKICFEITETTAINNLTYAQTFIDTLRAKRCSFSLDDFGTGLSSFAYLKSLPVDYVKIDGLFIKGILENKVDLTMVKSINEVGHVMDKKTIAEYVENQDILNLLHSLGVDYAQGYCIAKPVPLYDL